MILSKFGKVTPINDTFTSRDQKFTFKKMHPKNNFKKAQDSRVANLNRLKRVLTRNTEPSTELIKFEIQMRLEITVKYSSQKTNFENSQISEHPSR